MNKKILRYLEGFSFIILVALAGVGTIFLSTLVHELSHWQDLHKIAEKDSICLFNMPTDSITRIDKIYGSYTFTLDESIPNAEEKLAEIDEYTEFKAYSIQFIFIALVFLSSFSIVLWKRTLPETQKPVPIQTPIEFSYNLPRKITIKTEQ
jgi:hypothetical protein